MLTMGYFSSAFPRVVPTLDDHRFWELCAERRLCFQRCSACGRFRHPLMPICPSCQSAALTWVEVAGQGRIFSHTFVHHASHPAPADALPYNVVLVEFAECGGVRLISNVMDASPDDLRIGRLVTLAWDEGAGGQPLPRFRLTPPSA